MDIFLSKFVYGRVFEWYMACSTLFMSIGLILMQADIYSEIRFQWLLDFLSVKELQVIMLVLGFSRIVGLLLGPHKVWHKRLGPMIRSGAATLCAIIWAQFELAALNEYFVANVLSPGMFFWANAVIFELYVSYAAMAVEGKVKSGRVA